MAEEASSEGLEALIQYIKRTRQFDFNGYKRTTLSRRIGKRMDEVGCDDYSDYEDYLEVHPEEFTAFFNNILINVTSFFRDPPAWEFLADEVIPQIISGKDGGEPIRVWSAGCASGEEPYSLAILMCEMLGREQFRTRVKIYGTDIDEDALTRARQAVYSAKDVAPIPEEQIAKYFEVTPSGYAFSKDLRRSVIFGRHDLVQDAPISRLDLLVCRNTLMYFNAETQADIFERFRFALNGRGFLFLGKAETLLSQSKAFRPLEQKLRIFASVPDPSSPLRVPVVGRDADAPPGDAVPVTLRDAVLLSSPTPIVAVDLSGVVTVVSHSARVLFGVGESEVGRLLQDLELSYRPTDLRSLLDEAYEELRPVERRSVEHVATNGGTNLFDVIVTPLFDHGGALLGASIAFEDVTGNRRLQEELERSTRELETAYEELQSTNEELETTNEELQSTIEELETTNEELQSTNEELETMNEELQSTNDELQTVNDELLRRGAELDLANEYLESILSGMHRGVVVVDREVHVQLWNASAADLWGLRRDEVEGRHFANLEIGLPVEDVMPAIRHCLEGVGLEQTVLEARNRRGFDFRCLVTCSPLGHDGRPIGVIIVMEPLTVDGADARQVTG